MSGPQHLAPPGSSTYSSSTLHVGDGTWDASRNSFLLPNIQGLNYATMRYNGMGNRFRDLKEYHTLISGHGVLAAITFLGVVPASILMASFYYPNPRLALRTHISLQILTVLLTTVILVLGYFAVGPERSLTNPHHGIGVAIYVLVLIQAIGGSVIHKIEKSKMRYHIPIKLMLHQWVGRAIALLALAQIPIGLTLYGSPLVLFILYALVMSALIVLYFTLSYQSKKRAGAGYDERGSYVTGTQTELTDGAGRSDHRGLWAALTGALAGGAGLAALRRRKSDRQADATNSGVGSRADSGSYLTEKHGGENRGYNSWRDRLFGGAAGLGAVAGLREFMNRGKDREIESELSSGYRPPIGRAPLGRAPGEPLEGSVTQSTVHVNRMEEGLPVSNGNQHSRGLDDRVVSQQARIPYSNSNLRRSRESFGNQSPQRNQDNDRAGFAGFTGLRSFFQKRRERREQDRVDAVRQQEYENERVFGARTEQPIYAGDGTQRREGVRFDPAIAGSRTISRPEVGPPIPPIPIMSRHGSSSYGYGQQEPQQPLVPPPGPPRSMNATARGQNVGAAPPSRQESTRPLRSETYGSPAYGQRNIPGSGPSRDEAGPRGTLQEPPAVASPGHERAMSSDFNDNVESPPVSVKVNMYNDGRRVTVRRLNQDEAAVERDGVRRGDGRGRERRNEGYGRVRQDNPSQEATPPLRQPPPGQDEPGHQPSELNLPSPQRGPFSIGPGNSPGIGGSGGYDTGTDSYDTNRRRRRAERVRAEKARAGENNGRVEFS